MKLEIPTLQLKGKDMPLVKVKPKYQVLIPPGVREKAGVRVGDLLEATVKRGKITFTPKSVIDRDLEASLEEVRQGKTFGPFKSAKDFLRSLHKEERKLKKKSS